MDAGISPHLEYKVQMFTDHSDRIVDNPPQLAYGVSVADVDGDGAFEVLVAGFGFSNRVLKWADGSFVDVTPNLLKDTEHKAISIVAGDIDGDGFEEIYVLNSDTFGGPKQFGDRLYDHDGEAWADLFGLQMNLEVMNLTAGRSVVVVDRRGSGFYGFYVANYGGPMRLYELDLDGRIEDVAQKAGVNLVTGGRGAISLPLISDQMDIYAVNELGPNFLFRNRGDGTFEEIAELFNVDDPRQNGRGVTVLDANDDEQLDIVYGNWEGPHRLFIRREGRFVDEAPPEMQQPSKVRTVISGDFDNDGYQEVFFNNIGEANRLFARRRGDWYEVPIGSAAEPDGLGTGAAVGDFDQDGRLELIIAHGETAMQPLSTHIGPENNHNYLRVLPRTQFGAPARGAVVRLMAEERTQIRAIDAGSGYLCQMEPVAHFGLGEATNVDWLEVQWPDGKRQRIEAPDINQQLELPYPSEAEDSGSSGNS